MKVLHDIRWPEMLYETEEDAGASVKAIDDEMKPLIQPLYIHHKSVFQQQQQGANNQVVNVHDMESPPQLLFPPQISPSTHATKSPLSHNWLSPNAFIDNARGFFDTRSSTNVYTRVPASCPPNTGSDQYPNVEMHNLVPEEFNSSHSWSTQGQNDNIELSNDQVNYHSSLWVLSPIMISCSSFMVVLQLLSFFQLLSLSVFKLMFSL
jgi:hypothetical protein